MHIPSRSHRALAILVLSGIALAAFGSARAAPGATPPRPFVTEVTRQLLPELPGKEVLVLTVDYPPGAIDPVHRHDAHAIVYVLAGTIVMGVAGGDEVTIGPGQTFHEGPRDLHTVGRNASSRKPARFVVFLLKDIGKPALSPAD
jgi:quercetin dioxygenase-like cupin family protein